MNLNGKYAVVTGASTGIGQAMAVLFAKNGATVFAVGRNENGLKKTEELGGDNIQSFVVDLTSVEQIENFIKEVKLKTDKVDILANVADVWHLNGKHFFDTTLDHMPVELITQSIDVGLKASILLARSFVPTMNGWGRVINMSGAFSPDEKGVLPQYVTKKGIEMFTKQLALEYKDAGVTANAISPWYVWSESVQSMFPELKGDAMDPKDVAEFALKLCLQEYDGVTSKVWYLKKGQEPQATEL